MEASQYMVTLEKVREAAKRVVERQGADFVYNPGGRYLCVYVPTSDPRCPEPNEGKRAFADQGVGCLVGEIMKELGYLTDEVAGSINGISEVIAKEGLPFLNHAVHYLVDLQTCQDTGWSWGEALRRAEVWAVKRIMEQERNQENG